MGIKFNLSNEKEKQIPEEFKDLAKDFAKKVLSLHPLKTWLIGLEQVHYTG